MYPSLTKKNEPQYLKKNKFCSYLLDLPHKTSVADPDPHSFIF
jgi:hypothetical protein